MDIDQPQQPALLRPLEDFDIKSPVFIPRPGWGGRLKQWSANLLDSPTFYALLAGIALIGTVIFAIRYAVTRQHPPLTLATPVSIPKNTQEIPAIAHPLPLALTITAVRGQGVTHLARQAVRQYTQAKAIALAPEQKVYAEDWLRRRVNIQILYPQQQIPFPLTDVQHAVEKSQHLKKEELANLTQYARRVKEF